MRISTRGRYAVRLMLDLATNYTGKPIRLKDVAKRQEISDKYLEQIISILNKAGFVRSVRGPHDSPPHRRKPFPCGMSGRQRGHLRTGGKLCYTDPLEKTGRCYQRCGRQYNAGRPDELAGREGG